MQRNRAWISIGALVAALALTGCAKTGESEESSGDPAATLVEVKDSEPKVVLTDRALARIGLEVGVAEAAADGLSIPYDAVVYDEDGGTWVYTSPKELTFVRVPVTVADISRDRAQLSAGPEPGTEVVTVGTAELFGVEQGIGA
jgi:hypothetical protein